MEKKDSFFIDEWKCLLNDVQYHPDSKSFENLFEFNNAFFPLEKKSFSVFEIMLEMKKIENYYNFVFGRNFYKKYMEEAFHYHQLKYGLLSKIEFNKFYFDEQPIGSRKIVVHSEDCISLIQVLASIESCIFSVYMRSSEIENLFPVDLYGILQMSIEVGQHIYKEKEFSLSYIINIGSAHIYKNGDLRRKKYENI